MAFLKKSSHKKITFLRKALITLAVASLVGFALIGVMGAYFYSQVRDVNIQDLRGCFTTSWHKVKYCPSSAHHLRLSEAPEHLRWAILLAEDAGFYQHNGFDWFEIQESFQRNWEEKSFVRGASTISQQVVKNVLLSGEKTLSRKIKEAHMTRLLERDLKKNEILEIYINVVELGANIYGFKSAARHYFQVEPEELSPTQSAFLATLLPSPRLFEQHINKNDATHPRHERQIQRVLLRLVRHGKVEPEYLDVFNQRIELGLWKSFRLFPGDSSLWTHLPEPTESFPEELEAGDEDLSGVDLPLDPLNGPVGEENTQEDQDPNIE